jgi:hypothetical protein
MGGNPRFWSRLTIIILTVLGLFGRRPETCLMMCSTLSDLLLGSSNAPAQNTQSILIQSLSLKEPKEIDNSRNSQVRHTLTGLKLHESRANGKDINHTSQGYILKKSNVMMDEKPIPTFRKFVNEKE